MKKEKNNSKIKLAIVIIACVLAVIIIPSGIYCAVEKVTPAQMVSNIVVSNADRIIGKWQNEAGSNAYEFYENGTYDSYFSTFSYSGDYTVDGDELTLSNPNNDSTVVYKIKVSKDSLSMKVYKQSGLEANQDEETTAEFKRVERIQTKTIDELLDSITTSQKQAEE